MHVDVDVDADLSPLQRRLCMLFSFFHFVLHFRYRNTLMEGAYGLIFTCVTAMPSKCRSGRLSIPPIGRSATEYNVTFTEKLFSNPFMKCLRLRMVTFVYLFDVVSKFSLISASMVGKLNLG